MRGERTQARDEAIRSRVASGVTRVEVAREFGLSEPRISQITKGLPRPRNAHNVRLAGEVQARNQQIADCLEKGTSMKATAKEFGLSRERVRQIAARIGLPPRISVRRANRHEKDLEEVQRLERKHKDRELLIAAFTERVRKGESIRAAGTALGLKRGKTSLLAKELNLGALTRFGRWRKSQL